MTHRPEVLLSCAVSIDGYIDDISASRLLLSNDADFDRVDAVRADHDAILVGANTIRRDNPRLLIRSERRRHQREAAGRPTNPIKVTLTRSGDLGPGANFFPTGDGPKLVYTTAATAPKLAATLRPHATVIDAGESCDLHWMLADLADRGIQRLMVEGGGQLHTQFLTANLADELHLAVAPFFVGDHTAPRFAYDGAYHRPPHAAARRPPHRRRRLPALPTRMTDTATDHHWMRLAIQQSTLCPPSTTAYSVGAVIVGEDETLLVTGYSRETPTIHAEQSALAKLDPSDPRLTTATIYSTMEPCGARKSHPHPCAELLINAGIRRVVYALAEPPIFITPTGAQTLRTAGIDVIHLADLAPDVEDVNRHILNRGSA